MAHKHIHILIYSLLATALIFSSACKSERSQHVKAARARGPVSIAEKDSAAFFFFKNEEYERAEFLFEELIPIYRGNQRLEEVMYSYAYCKYQLGLYIPAAFNFERFVRLYPTSEHAEESSYMKAYCYYLESDPYYLDQRTTQKAIDEMQLFVAAFPESKKKVEAKAKIDKLQNKLAKKDFEQATLYYKIGEYKAASVAFRVMIQEYPGSEFREEAEYMKFEAMASLADVSVKNKQINRYLDAIDAYEDFVDQYPSSKFVRSAESTYNRISKSVTKLQEEQNQSDL